MRKWIEYTLIVCASVALMSLLAMTIWRPYFKGDTGATGAPGKDGKEGQTLILLPDPVNQSLQDSINQFNNANPEPTVNSTSTDPQFEIPPCWPAEDPNHCGEDMNVNGTPISPYDNRL